MNDLSTYPIILHGRLDNVFNNGVATIVQTRKSETINT